MKKEKQNKAFDKMAKAIMDYMKLNGWFVAVIGEPKVYHSIGDLKYNYSLTFGFTGKESAKKKKET